MRAVASFDRRSKRQRQSEDPVARHLGALQAEVMDVFWASEGATVRDALDSLNARREKKLAYTTVLTVVARLWQRDFLEREPEGRGFRYRAVRGRDELLGELTDRSIDQLLNDFGDIAVARLGERLENLDPERAKKLGAARRKPA
jgi:predicted transcriptional regulator